MLLKYYAKAQCCSCTVVTTTLFALSVSSCVFRNQFRVAAAVVRILSKVVVAVNAFKRPQVFSLCIRSLHHVDLHGALDAFS